MVSAAVAGVSEFYGFSQQRDVRWRLIGGLIPSKSEGVQRFLLGSFDERLAVLVGDESFAGQVVRRASTRFSYPMCVG